MKEKFIRFMQGRYGADQFSNFLLGFYFFLFFLSLIFNQKWLNYIGQFCLLFSLYRSFSKNYSARNRENQLYRKYSRPIKQHYKALVNNLRDKEKKYFVCPSCHQLVRVPRKHGKIEIKCPSCQHHFTRRS